jgi:hypothetical protein
VKETLIFVFGVLAAIALVVLGLEAVLGAL